jgi:hypothetical protein
MTGDVVQVLVLVLVVLVLLVLLCSTGTGTPVLPMLLLPVVLVQPQLPYKYCLYWCVLAVLPVVQVRY